MLDADLVINLPKMKTHTLTRYTGAVKNLLGVLPGGRKREIHVRAPGVTEFSRALVDILGLVKPQLNIMDGILGMEGNGPGTSGTPHAYNLLAASTDAVALDSVLAGAMGFSTGGVVHLAQAEERGLGNHHPELIHLAGDRTILQLGRLDLPKARWFLDMPSWFTAPIQEKIKLQPQIDPTKCTACGTCAECLPGGCDHNPRHRHIRPFKVHWLHVLCGGLPAWRPHPQTQPACPPGGSVRELSGEENR